MRSAARSFTLPPGCTNSALAKRRPGPLTMRPSCTSGVLPIRSRALSRVRLQFTAERSLVVPSLPQIHLPRPEEVGLGVEVVEHVLRHGLLEGDDHHGALADLLAA